MLELRAHVPAAIADQCAAALDAIPGVTHMSRLPPATDGTIRLEADVDEGAIDQVFSLLEASGVPPEGIGVRRAEWIRPTSAEPTDAGSLLWVDLLGSARLVSRIGSKYIVLDGRGRRDCRLRSDHRQPDPDRGRNGRQPRSPAADRGQRGDRRPSVADGRSGVRVTCRWFWHGHDCGRGDHDHAHWPGARPRGQPDHWFDRLNEPGRRRHLRRRCCGRRGGHGCVRDPRQRCGRRRNLGNDNSRGSERRRRGGHRRLATCHWRTARTRRQHRGDRRSRLRDAHRAALVRSAPHDARGFIRTG